MNTFKKKSMYAAVLAGLGMVGMASTASAVYVNPNGLGQVLIYPYYTAQGGNVTAFSVVNTGDTAKAVKVRFREGKNSREVLDFNLYLSPRDVWTGAVSATATGAKLTTTDKSCTVPAIPAAGVEFRNVAYAGTAAVSTGLDGAGTGLDRTREGYFEMIELGVMSNTAQIGYVTHANGTPANCAAIVAVNDTVSLTTPTNELMGGASIINVATGVDFTFDATTFADFLLPGSTALTTVLGNEQPNLNEADEVSTIFRATTTGADAVVSNWGNGVNAVSATLMHNAIMNEYVLDNATLSGTDWVVNFPTKRYYVQSNTTSVTPAITGTVTAPFQRTFWNGACDDITINYWDREEKGIPSQSTVIDFSPSIPGTSSQPALCWETNVVTFNNANVLSSATMRNIDVGTNQNGWAAITFRTAATLVSAGGAGETGGVAHTYAGLPVIGFAVQDFNNLNAAPGVMATYGGNFFHKATRIVTP